MHRGGGRVDVHATVTPTPFPVLGWKRKSNRAKGTRLASSRSPSRGERSGTGEAEDGITWRFSSDLHCPDCDIHYSDRRLAHSRSTLRWAPARPAAASSRDRHRPGPGDTGPEQEPARRRGQAVANQELQGVPARPGKIRAPLQRRADVAWSALSEREQRWVIDGDPAWSGRWQTQWYGVRRYFEWLESKAYKMHIRVLLSRYRSYTPARPAAQPPAAGRVAVAVQRTHDPAAGAGLRSTG